MPTGRNQYHHGNLRAAILAEAQTMLSESGADGLSLREAARRTGVSHGAPRRHFPDKQALLSALVEQGYEQLGARIESALSGTVGDFTERLTAFACAYVDFARHNEELMTLMLSSKTWPDAGDLIAANDRAFAPAVELLRQAAGSGDIACGRRRQRAYGRPRTAARARVCGRARSRGNETHIRPGRRRGQGLGQGNPSQLTSDSDGHHRRPLGWCGSRQPREAASHEGESFRPPPSVREGSQRDRRRCFCAVALSR